MALDKTIDKDMDIYAGCKLIARGELSAKDTSFKIKITETEGFFGEGAGDD